MRILFLVLLTGCAVLCGYAQQKDISGLENGRDTITNFSEYKRGVTFGGLLQTRFVASLTRNVDVSGKNFPDTVKGVTNTFNLKRVRVQVKANVNDHFSAGILFNLAEFSSDPINKVLENAYIRYSLNKYFNLQAGQFRPFFGIEDALPVDIIRTLDYSNQYYAFGANGWQSFQVGLSVFGEILSRNDFTLKYYAGAYNGNNRNQPADNNNTKNFYGRLELLPGKNLTVGVNAASGSLGGNAGTGSAWGADFLGQIDLSEKWAILFSAEFKNGTSFTNFNSSSAVPKPPLSDFRMKGFYLFPILRFEYKRPRVRAMELSARYEYLEDNYKLTDNPRQTITPNLSLIFADNFFATIQTGVNIDLFRNDIPLTTTYSHSLAYVQLQIRY
ncbi:porin [Flavihumibacter petaseus]|uniref:Porin n=1 Tax=Flavihumibacter petaseus NBRC 106054 TaxID=1220578 RepID=A0A0E9N2H0_9BACT|nr:porin [Flavihumibacter petaseus]GAO43520.1 hypothetical protein FPE01S_02_06250 [Flavihumibacter petaseus NBRC 106054]